jgi:hypothetical protein
MAKEKGRGKMKKFSIVIFLGLFLTSVSVFAVQQGQNLTVNMGVVARAKLTVTPSTINFPDADPDAVPSIPANENAISVTANVRTGASSTATLTHRASGDLSTGSGIKIPIGNVSWTATGTGYVGGKMSSSSDVLAGSWAGSGSYGGNFSYFIVNSWSYTTGNYTVSTTYTLTAP